MDCVHFGFDVYILIIMKVAVPSISKQLTEDQIFKSINEIVEISFDHTLTDVCSAVNKGLVLPDVRAVSTAGPDVMTTT